MKTEIDKLKKEKNAIILAHYYVEDEIQDIADFVGDSLELSRKASNTNADIIVFAGVHFMAETAKILSPDKKVLVPDMKAGCPLADSMTVEKFREFKMQYPDYFTVNYINTNAEIKAESDLICTSSNAVDLVKSLPKDTKIMFGPDKNLGAYVKSFVPNDFIIWDGYCPVHENFSSDKLKELKIENPDAKVLAHPEANKNVLLMADVIGSTKKIIDYAIHSDDKKFIIATEPGVFHKIKQNAPDKELIALPPVTNHSQSICYNMKKNSVKKILHVLETEENEIILDKEIIEKAYKPIKRMLDLSIKLGLVK